jgi:hypothetical protein
MPPYHTLEKLTRRRSLKDPLSKGASALKVGQGNHSTTQDNVTHPLPIANHTIHYQAATHEQGKKKVKEQPPSSRSSPHPPGWTDPRWSVENNAFLIHRRHPITIGPQPENPRHVSLMEGYPLKIA